jgi:serine/threonine protein kinase
VYEATHNDLKIPVTLKIMRHPPAELVRYLKRFKDLKAENIIKIYEIFDNEEGLFLSTEPVTFSNFKSALQKCKKLDDFDAIFIAKIILATHADLLRAGFDWFGTE